jgi:hypothetical protein
MRVKARVVSRQWTVDSCQWAVDSGQLCTVGSILII